MADGMALVKIHSAPAWNEVSEKEIVAELQRTGVVRVETPFCGSALYVPKDRGPHAGIVTLHGSEGGDAGFTDLEAIRLAARGFSVLAFDYFGNSKCLPHKLANVELDRTREAADWLKRSPYVDGRKVGLLGVSRGAEQALYLASKDRGRFDAVAVHAPHATLVGSYDRRTDGPVLDAHRRALPSWLDHGKATRPGDVIRIERFRGPVFMAHGTRDTLWGVEETRALEKRIHAAGKRAEVHYFAGEGHILGFRSAVEEERLFADFFSRSLR